MVASFDAARITFVNLAPNVGEQSGPNSEGVRLARGRHLAFLNHDDLYFPDHLAAALAHLARTGSDLVWAPVINALPVPVGDLSAGRWAMRLAGVAPGDDYEPRTFVVAYAWVMTRALGFRERALANAAINAEREAGRYRLGRALRSLVVRPLTAAAERLGRHPLAPLYALRYGRRGSLVNRIRRQTGLGTMPR